jgi:hypothetical protein
LRFFEEVTKNSKFTRKVDNLINQKIRHQKTEKTAKILKATKSALNLLINIKFLRKQKKKAHTKKSTLFAVTSGNPRELKEKSMNETIAHVLRK